ncbi:F-type H+-transporting ATPase subunit epsilon [Entomoplasma freundtii]|uniref:F0F1 ATP synthase subunit epsilon n=1 Tax=Entomoplasma freundtii TaxID=74700 RepID=A0A2K8NSB5_9MOLU|nr:F0F1 ATP synthase subunit epsilon [Entomoplasma freundtii]ATZ16667.1 F0F1 ATP synthase subunit epsilon [Entomoplasma freundtii]TDY58166.1 F-type H+-transporting ATPase subunit epsilon [Entomoplasma freundtii]
MGLKLRIVTPNGRFINDKVVDIVNIQSIDGDMGILEHSIPIVTALKIGVVTFREKDVTTYVHVHRGIMETDGELCTIITERLYLVDANKQRLETPHHLS